MKYFLFSIMAVCGFLAVVGYVPQASAATIRDDSSVMEDYVKKNGAPSAPPAPAKKSDCASGKLCNPLGYENIQDLLPALLDIVAQFGLLICTFFIILAGFKYVTAQGNATEIEKAHKILLWAVVGTAVLLGAKVLASILSNTVNQVIKK